MRWPLFKVALCGGLVLLALALVLLLVRGSRAYNHRINSYLERKEFEGLVREAKDAWWPGESDRATEVLNGILAAKAERHSPECKAAGDTAFPRSAQVLVWNTERRSVDAAESQLDRARMFPLTAGPLTVLLVGGKHSMQVGTYSISHQPAYREGVDVCVVQFDALGDPGKAVAYHEVVSMDPRYSRPVSNQPEHADPAPAIANWIECELAAAARDGNLERARALVKANPGMVSCKDGGRTPLHFAASGGRREIAELLLANRAEVDARDDLGQTPLLLAASGGQREVAELLLGHNADVNAKSDNGTTPLKVAMLKNHQDLVLLLRQHGGQE